MASIQMIERDKGLTFKIQVSCNGKKKFKTYVAPKGMSKKKAISEANRQADDFESKIKKGISADDKQTFEKYAEKVVKAKLKKGDIRERTAMRYRELLARIYPAIGNIKVTEITRLHLNALYENLEEEGIRQTEEKATPKIDIAQIMKEKKLSLAEMGRRTGIAPSTMARAKAGETVSRKTAEGIAKALEMSVNSLFTFEKDNSPLSSKTRREYHNVIESVLQYAIEESIIEHNPAKDAKKPKVQTKKEEGLQTEDVDIIRECLTNESIKWETMINLFISAGLRRGELCGLKWSDYDRKNNVLKIRRSLLQYNGLGTFEADTKTKESKRDIPLPEAMKGMLKSYEAYYLGEKLKYSDSWEDNGYMFFRENGKCISPDSVTQYLSKFAKKYELHHIHPHQLRHYYGSFLISNDVDIPTVSRLMGHSNITTTLNIYTHPLDSGKEKAIACLNEAYRAKEA